MVKTGRYEFIGGTSAKFWELKAFGGGEYGAIWGRIGKAHQGPTIYDEAKAEKVVAGKIKKGYVFVAR